jgi:hypothetical protein
MKFFRTYWQMHNKKKSNLGWEQWQTSETFLFKCFVNPTALIIRFQCTCSIIFHIFSASNPISIFRFLFFVMNKGRLARQLTPILAWKQVAGRVSAVRKTAYSFSFQQSNQQRNGFFGGGISEWKLLD